MSGHFYLFSSFSILLHYLLKKIIKGDVEGYIARERPRAEYMTQIIQDSNKGYYKDLKELCHDRETWRTTATNKSTDF